METNLQNQKNVFKAHPKYKNIIFDLGGVLLYWNAQEIISQIFKDHEQIPHDIINAVTTDLWGNLDRGTMTQENVVDKLSDQFDREKLLKFMQEVPNYLKPMETGLQIFKEIKKLGYKTYILSNLQLDAYIKIHAEYDFLKEFDGAIFSYQHKTIKPEPEIYNILLNTYSLNPSECLFIDDLENNILGANNLGIDGIVCKNHDYLRKELKRLNILD